MAFFGISQSLWEECQKLTFLGGVSKVKLFGRNVKNKSFWEEGTKLVFVGGGENSLKNFICLGIDKKNYKYYATRYTAPLKKWGPEHGGLWYILDLLPAPLLGPN